MLLSAAISFLLLEEAGKVRNWPQGGAKPRGNLICVNCFEAFELTMKFPDAKARPDALYIGIYRVILSDLIFDISKQPACINNNQAFISRMLFWRGNKMLHQASS